MKKGNLMKLMACLGIITVLCSGCFKKKPADSISQEPSPRPSPTMETNQPGAQTATPKKDSNNGTNKGTTKPTNSPEKKPDLIPKDGEKLGKGGYLGNMDNNIIVIIEQAGETLVQGNYKIMPELDLEKIGIEEGTSVEYTYKINEDNQKVITAIRSVQ